MKTVAQLLSEATSKLRSCTDTPRLDAEILLAYALNLNRAQLMARLNESVNSAVFEAFIERRCAFEPIAYILGEWEFFSLKFLCRPPVFIPRSETEILVEKLLVLSPRSVRLLDVGTGTGCIAIAVAVNNPLAQIVALDKSAVAIKLARENARLHHVESRVSFLQADGLSPFARKRYYDVICSNPPYVEASAWDGLSRVITLHEDRDALLSGEDGLDMIRRLVLDSRILLRPGGLLLLEIGMGQALSVRDILHQNGFDMIDVVEDLSGIERVVIARS